MFKPVRMVLLFNFLAFILMYFYGSENSLNVLLLGLAVIFTIGILYHIIKVYDWGDEYLFLIASMLCSIGILMIYRLDPDYGIRQIKWFGLGTAVFFLTFIFLGKTKFWSSKPMIYAYPLISIFLFSVTLIFGQRIGGAKNWIEIFGINVQPWEIIKLLYVFYAGLFFSNRELIYLPTVNLKGKAIKINSIFLFSLISYVHLGFLVLQREWGGAVLLFLIFFSFLYAFDNHRSFLFVNGVFALVGGFVGYLLLDHIQVRIWTWIDPWSDMAGKGYQITQSLFAIGAGGFFGTGIGLGNPEIIPEVHTDFIFSAICEEMGIFGGVAVVLLYFLLVYRGIKISLRIDNIFYKAASFGITAIFGFQTFIIIGGVIKLVPLTGITLPFISYGGSSLISTFLALGALQAVSMKNSFSASKVVEADE
ncbi:FtsW/RodA/SpoVE family cell cycle protein [Alkalibacter sp. M17DMB]|nr:FtsW/RodA/SpoVE family cell cycle protein [Alkalibacter mobilis]